jgi:hypothetical protein
MGRKALAAVAAALLVGLASAGAAIAATRTTHTASLTRSTYVARADQLCRVWDKRVTRAENGIDSGSISREVAAMRRAVKVRRQFIGKVRALKPPKRLAASASAVWNAFAATTTAVNKTATDLDNLDVDRLSSDESKATKAYSRYHKLARRFGFRYCGAKS